MCRTACAILAMLLSVGCASASDWRDSVKVWKVEMFFGKWIVVADYVLAPQYKSNWKWLAIREAKRLSSKHGGKVSIEEEH